jgi:hypothetical protein
MMRFLVILCSLLVAVLSGCSTTTTRNDHVTLIEVAPGKLLLAVVKREHVGIWGPEGYVASRRAGYWAALEGSGPMFTNPHFQDDSSDLRCVGTIALDREHSMVTLNMQRVVSEPGKPQRTKHHPANGTYVIESIRKARPGESWF